MKKDITATKKNLSPLKEQILLLGAILLSIVGGIFIGSIAAAIGSIFYMVLVFPFMIGVFGGSTLRAAIKLAKVRKASQLLFLSLLVAVTMYGTYHFGRYMLFQGAEVVKVSSELKKAPDVDPIQAANVIVNYGLKQETGHAGFLGYMLYKAQQGVSIGHWYGSNRLNLGPVFTWVYWLLELGIITYVAMSAGKKELLVPICDCCGSRYGKEKHLGGTSLDRKSTLLELIERREFLELGKLLEKNTDVPSIELYMRACEACEKGTAHVTVQRVSKSSTGRMQFADMLKVALQPQERSLLFRELRVE